MGGIAQKKKRGDYKKGGMTFKTVNMCVDEEKPKGKEGLVKSYKSPDDLLRGAFVSVGRFESQLSHRGHKIRLLQRFRQRGREQVARFHLGPTVGTNGNYRGGCVFVVSAFDVSCSTFTVNYRHMQIHEDTIEFWERKMSANVPK
jgi:hypothetical protein